MFSVSSNKLNLIKILNILASILIVLALSNILSKIKSNLCCKLKDGCFSDWLQHSGFGISLLALIYMTISIYEFNIN